MTPIEFPEQTMIWAKDQKEYQPLPAFTDQRQTISCWKLDWKELIKLVITRKLWLYQINFSQALQPQYLTVNYPFTIKIEEK